MVKHEEPFVVLKPPRKAGDHAGPEMKEHARKKLAPLQISRAGSIPHRHAEDRGTGKIQRFRVRGRIRDEVI